MPDIYKSISDMLQNSIDKHPEPSNEYEKGFIAGLKEAKYEVIIAGDFKE